ncbi:uncharacterized protein LOC100836305 isoform X2 [Brachypodium distachyon]|nr:uncharacterized protein LOC100836305 isoform X2 [Brachypodium distachyon]|eukprot:XP_014751019.2 uncharacterized protein LOC100836305 isoform X2 [Brachypodium distachyon]
MEWVSKRHCLQVQVRNHALAKGKERGAKNSHHYLDTHLPKHIRLLYLAVHSFPGALPHDRVNILLSEARWSINISSTGTGFRGDNFRFCCECSTALSLLLDALEELDKSAVDGLDIFFYGFGLLLRLVYSLEKCSMPAKYTLRVDGIDGAVKQLLDLLRDNDGTAEGKIQAFFFSGLNGSGLGASVVLEATAKLLKSTRSDPDTRNHFGKIVHVDCSLWKNRRTMQRAIAEELNLQHLMPIFYKHDEDDDFRGVDGSSREEITSIGSAIHESLVNGKFLLIFHYGGDAYLDLADCGIPKVGAFGKGILLWTNYGRFQFFREEQKLMATASIDMEIHGITYEYMRQTMRPFVHNEVVQVIGYTGMDGINPATFLDCFLYLMFLTEQLRENSIIGVDYGWSAHACNYWVCDGIIGGDRAWEIGNALYEVIPLSGYPSYITREHLFNIPESLRKELKEYLLDERRKPHEGWCSVTSNKQAAEDISNVPDSASSYFLTFQGDDPGYLHGDMFRVASNLRVLKLCNCSFNFSSPPFHCCQNLRFLWLDRCTNTEKKQGGGSFFPNLLVFDLRFTEYVLLPQIIESMTSLRELNTVGVSWKSICHAWEKLHKLNKLRVRESSDFITFDSCSSKHVNNLELLDLSGNTLLESLPTLSSERSLKMLVLDGCSSLEQVALEGGAPLLESFSFDGYGPVEDWTHSIQLPQKELRLKTPIIAPLEKAKVTKISLHGCVLLHDIFLRALPYLEELDLSCTAIKTLDLNAMDVPQLKKLFLLGCHQLRSLLWDGWKTSLTVLHIDTQVKGRSTTCPGEKTTFDFEACIAFTDGRFIWSAIEGLYLKIFHSYLPKVYLLISCMSYGQASITKGIQEISPNEEGMVPKGTLLTYSDIALAKDVTHSSLVWDRQQLQPSRTHIEIGEGSYNLESMQDDVFFRYFIDYCVESLYLHDNSSITAIPPTTPASWTYLKWCHVEKCPKLHTLFTCWIRHDSFQHITIFSASDLVMAYCIWVRSIDGNFGRTGFQQLQHIYLHNCPRLVFVLPISFSLPNLESIQIAYCSNIRHVFPLHDEVPQEIASGVTFTNLKHIKLHHLHKLEQICEVRLTAPVLETIGLRDCWGLRRLPAVASHGPKPVVDCEKDWWDKLEWDGLDAGHDPSLFQTRHSAYYKKTIPRGSVLR